MTDEELRVRAIQELEFYKKDDTFMLADITVDLAIEALEQMPVITTTGGSTVIYYPQVEGVTPTVVDAGKQEPCDNCKYLDGDGCRLVFEQAENGEASDECPNDNNELPSVNPQPCQEKWIDEDDNRYICKECEYAHKPQKEPCEDAISRDDALMCLTGEIKSTDTIETIIARFARRIRELPPVNPTKTGHWEQYGNSWEDKFKCSECGKEQPKILCGERISGHWSDYCPNCGCRMIEPQESEGEA